jgi:hypothetical protein
MVSISNSSRAASKIALIYALTSVAWILFSDQLLAATVTTVETMTLLQMLKGWAFVLTTSGVIFFLMRQEMDRFFKADLKRIRLPATAPFTVCLEHPPVNSAGLQRSFTHS